MEDQAAEIATLRFARKKLEANLLFFMTKLEKELPAFEKRRKQVQELRMMLVRPIHPSHAQWRSVCLCHTECSQHALQRRHTKRDKRSTQDSDASYEVSEEVAEEDELQEDGVPLASQEAAEATEYAEVIETIKDVRCELDATTAERVEQVQPLSEAECTVFGHAQDLFELTIGPNERRLFALHAYYSLRECGNTAVKAVKLAACASGVGVSTLYRLRQEAEAKGYVPDDGRTAGDGATQRWILGRDEGLQHQLREFIFDNTDQRGEPNITVPQITAWINSTLLREGIAAERPGYAEISERSTHRWLKKLGFEWKVEKRAGFVDGHESEENVNGAHGRLAYLKEMKEIRDANKEVNEYNAALFAEMKELEERLKDARGTKRQHPQQLTRAPQRRELLGKKCVECALSSSFWCAASSRAS